MTDREQVEALPFTEPLDTDEFHQGVDYAMELACKLLGADPQSFSWDAATEEFEGDVLAVLGNMFGAAFGDDTNPDALRALLRERDAAEALALEPFGEYRDTLAPFLAMMVKELRDNKGKGDRPGWLKMDVKTALLEIYYHLGKLQKASKNNDLDGVREYSADVANMSMMLADIFGVLESADALATSPNALEEHDALVRADERERCALIADGIGLSYGDDEVGWFECSETIAAAIREQAK